MTRRSLIAALPIAGLALASCSSASNYEQEAELLWDTPKYGDRFSELVHYATLAANSHNAQPWTYSGNEKRLFIAPDFRRTLPAADPDNHHLYASLGCAAENLMLAAGKQSLAAAMEFDPTANGSIVIDVAANGTVDPLFHAITKRQCTRNDYDGKAIPANALDALVRAAKLPGSEVMLVTDKAQIEKILELTVQANTLQVENAAFAEELKTWIRFSEGDAIESRDGLYAACSGNPTMPGWLGRMMFGWVFSAASENEKYVRQIRSSAGLAIFVSEKDDKEHWIAAGRAFQRFALQASALDIRVAFLNQAIEVPQIRKELAALLGLKEQRADFVVRFGYGTLMPRSLRRPIDQVIAA